ncbi:MAG TPA: glycerol-3-phosphate 1-O-acyltransferase PlsY [Thermodesulfobacteriota bacterium]|nr:glycerol-3-phosphate 1-O-acyltransferase PlsY [Thermodesulfobacteriota bacterium]
MTLEIIILGITAYLIGSIPTGIIVAKILGAPDPRAVGSGNIGATNVGRAAGKAAGIITLIGDVLKGFLITLLALYILGSSSETNSPLAISIVAFSVFLGHLFPVFLKFKGGKGVATTLGVFLAIGPLQAILALIIFIILVAIFKYVSVASMIASVSIPLLLNLSPATSPYVPLAVIISVLIILKHSDNIKRLIQGTENKIGRKKGQ